MGHLSGGAKLSLSLTSLAQIHPWGQVIHSPGQSCG